jgi:glycosyltransferase involved in cell wall biosynthesis
MLVRNLSIELVGRGHVCRLLFMSHAAGVGNPPEFEADFLARLKAAGIGFDVMPPNSFRNVFSAARQFRKAVKAFRPDVVHAHLGRGLLCRSLSGAGLPTVYTHHSVTANFPPSLFRLFNRTVDQYVAVSAACHAFLQRYARGPIVTIPNGVPADFSAGGPRETVSRPPLVLAVGSLRAAKDYPTLIQAAALVAARAPAEVGEIRFAIVGEGVERPRLEQLIRDRGLSQTVELLGARGDVPALMQQADLLVNSSAYEGMPVTLIEGTVSALPIVATAVGGNAEVVADGVTGFIVPPADPAALADRILAVLTEPGRHAAFSRAARARSEAFGMAACADAHLDVYERARSARRG